MHLNYYVDVHSTSPLTYMYILLIVVAYFGMSIVSFSNNLGKRGGGANWIIDRVKLKFKFLSRFFLNVYRYISLVFYSRQVLFTSLTNLKQLKTAGPQLSVKLKQVLSWCTCIKHFTVRKYLNHILFWLHDRRSLF
jgi:hypothetical protein